MEIPGKLVVRTYAPARRWIMLTLLLLLGALALYGSFELGRHKAGYDAMQAAAERNTLEQRIDALQSAQRTLQQQLATAEEARVAEVRERTEVSRTIGELQAQIERQQQDVEFYRGLANQPAAPAAPIRVQEFRVVAQDPTHAVPPQSADGGPQYSMRFNLFSRATRPEGAVDGTLVVTIEGTRDGTPASADLAALTGAKGELSFNFRYYTHIEQLFRLPTDFKPERVDVEVRLARRGAAPYRQTFVWTVDPA